MSRPHLFYFLLAPLVLVVGCSQQPAGSAPSLPTGQSPSGKTSVNPADVKLEIVSFEGITDRIAAHWGQVVVLDAWSTSCPPCITEFHNLVELHQQYPHDQLACMSLSFDYEGIGQPQDQVARVQKFLLSQGATFENLLSSDESDVLYRKLQLASIPAVFVYDKAGKLRKRFDNEKAKTKDAVFTYEQVRELVAELVKEPTPPGETSGDEGPSSKQAAPIP